MHMEVVAGRKFSAPCHPDAVQAAVRDTQLSGVIGGATLIIGPSINVETRQ